MCNSNSIKHKYTLLILFLFTLPFDVHEVECLDDIRRLGLVLKGV